MSFVLNDAMSLLSATTNTDMCISSEKLKVYPLYLHRRQLNIFLADSEKIALMTAGWYRYHAVRIAVGCCEKPGTACEEDIFATSTWLDRNKSLQSEAWAPCLYKSSRNQCLKRSVIYNGRRVQPCNRYCSRSGRLLQCSHVKWKLVTRIWLVFSPTTPMSRIARYAFVDRKMCATM